MNHRQLFHSRSLPAGTSVFSAYHAMTRLTAALGLSLLLPLVVSTKDWPQLRGANRVSAWNETGILKTYPVEGLKIRWRAPAQAGHNCASLTAKP